MNKEVPNVMLCPSTKEERELHLAWRNDPEIFQGFYSQSKSHHIISWKEHCEWMESRNSDWMHLTVWHNLRRVGAVNIGQLDHWSPEIGYYIGEKSLWGMGIGREAVRQALMVIKTMGKEYAHTTILDSNLRSIELVKGLGFQYLGVARPGESWYQVNIEYSESNLTKNVSK